MNSVLVRTWRLGAQRLELMSKGQLGIDASTFGEMLYYRYRDKGQLQQSSLAALWRLLLLRCSGVCGHCFGGHSGGLEDEQREQQMQLSQLLRS